MRTRSTPCAAEGFTLVELLVAVTLLAMLTVVLFGGLRFGTRAQDAVSGRIDRSSNMTLVEDFLQNVLTDARPLHTGTDPSSSPVEFDGELDSVSFVVTPPAYLALGGFHLLHIGLETGVTAPRLMVSWQGLPRGPAAAQPSALRPSVLLDKVRAVRFAYFGEADANQPPQWLDRWADRDDLPQLVRVRIVLADGARAPDLIVAPRLVEPAEP